MKCNVGGIDRIVRIVLGIIFIILGFSTTGTLSIIFDVIGVILLLTAIIGFCILYLPFGINTCKKG